MCGLGVVLPLSFLVVSHLGFRVKGLGYIPGVGFRLRVLAVWGVGRWVKLGLGFKSLWGWLGSSRA